MDERTEPSAEPTETLAAKLGRRQIAVADRWAYLYPQADRDNIDITKRGEIVFCAPIFYSREVDFEQLPSDLRNVWKSLLDFADHVAINSAERAMAWTTEENGLEKVHSLVFDDDVKPEMRGIVGEVARLAAMVFDLSIERVGCDLPHYDKYVRDAEAWLKDIRNS
ncbi:MAG: hypothetical protein ACM3KH_00685 [Thiobacillus sp.]